MFIGREKELALLQQDYIGKAAMVYGKRRVGKTTLIQKALKSSSYRTVYFECLKGYNARQHQRVCAGIGPGKNPTCAIEFWYHCRMCSHI